MKSMTSRQIALIGDVVASRTAPDRRALHDALTGALTGSGTAITVGDEFQGTFSSLGAALGTALTIRLILAPGIDVRFGIGAGAVTLLDETTGVQDGPGWWAAREAIEWTAATQTRPGLAYVRTTFRSSRPDPAPDAVNAALLCRDQLLGSLDGRSVRLLAGLRTGRTRRELAAVEGISASAVSQRVARDGIETVLLASRWLEQLP